MVVERWRVGTGEGATVAPIDLRERVLGAAATALECSREGRARGIAAILFLFAAGITGLEG